MDKKRPLSAVYTNTDGDIDLSERNPKKARKGKHKKTADFAGTEKKTKKREIHDRSSVYLRDESTSHNGILHLRSPMGMEVTNTPSVIVPTRSEHTSDLLVRDPKASQSHIQSALTSSALIKERPLIELLGPVHLPSVVSAQGASVSGPRSSVTGVPIEEAIITMTKEFSQRVATMHDLRVALKLPTSLEFASESVRLASGLLGPTVSNGTDDSIHNAGDSHETSGLPALVGIPAVTLAKTRETLRPQGKLANAHGFAYESSRKLTVVIKDAYEADLAKHYAVFFKWDPVPVPATSDGGGSVRETRRSLRPDDFAVFQQLKREHGERFAKRYEFLEEAASKMPRPRIHEITWNYILSKRFPARGIEKGEPPCPLGHDCVWQKLARSYGTEIDGPPPSFYYPDEMEEWARTGKFPEGARLCYDDQIIALGRQALKPNANLEEPILPINPFSVRCEEGRHFDPQYALPNIVGNGMRKTGIHGFVPRFANYHRQFVMVRRPGDPPNAPLVRVLADITPIF